MAYAADQIVINGVQLKHLEKLEITNEAGEHGGLCLCGYLEETGGEETLYGFKEQDVIRVLAGGKLLFSGIVTKAEISGLAGTVKLSVEAKTRSILLDRRKKSRSFQDTSMTYGGLVKTILADYPGSDILLSIADRPIGEIAVQYRETDWAFLKRMLSMLHAVLSCRAAAETIQLYGGVPATATGGFSYEARGFRKEFGTYRYWQRQGAAVNDIDFFVAEAVTEQIPELFQEAAYAGKTFVVRKYAVSMQKGMLCCAVSLQKKEGILAPALYPMHLIGVALEGKVLRTKGTKIQIHLKIDDGNPLGDVYWFPFSTLSASPDGSGWYYMPEDDDSVRVYFPSKYTRDVTAVSAVSAYDGKGGGPDRMGSPSTKYLSNPGGQQMKMGEDGVALSSGGAAGVVMGNDGSMTISSCGTIEITAENNVSIEAEEAVELTGSVAALISCAKGGTLNLPENGDLYLQGTEVKLD